MFGRFAVVVGVVALLLFAVIGLIRWAPVWGVGVIGFGDHAPVTIGERVQVGSQPAAPAKPACPPGCQPAPSAAPAAAPVASGTDPALVAILGKLADASNSQSAKIDGVSRAVSEQTAAIRELTTELRATGTRHSHGGSPCDQAHYETPARVASTDEFSPPVRVNARRN